MSGAARHTYRFAAGDAGQHQAVFAELIAVEAMLLQPFQQSVLEQGEISLMVMDGRVSHAIRKTPKANDFRVQDDHGGTVHAHEASAEEIAHRHVHGAHGHHHGDEDDEGEDGDHVAIHPIH